MTKKSLDTTFDKFMGAFSQVQTDKKANFKSDLRDLYLQWAVRLQGAKSQFEKVADFFNSIDKQLKGWDVYYSGDSPLNDDFNGYTFEITLQTSGPQHGGKTKGIGLSFAQCKFENFTLNGKSTIWGLGKEAYINLPAGYALEFDQIDEEGLIKHAITNLPTDEEPYQRGPSRSQRIFELRQEGYDLTKFYDSKYHLGDNLNSIKNHLVILEAYTCRYHEKRHHGFEIDCFNDSNIEDILKVVFMKVNEGELDPLTEYLSELKPNNKV